MWCVQMTIQISELISDPDFAQAFTVTRTAGQWVSGVFTNDQPVYIPFIGVIEPMKTQDMLMFPEGDNIRGLVNVYTIEPIYTTRLDESTGTSGAFSDEITWQGEQYKIIQVQNYSDFGYYKAIAARKLGA